MFGKLLFSACLALALAHNPNAQDKCPPDQSHYLLPHEWDCTKFYYCEYGQRWDEPRDCAPGTEFSYKLQVCIHPIQANCTLPNVPPTEGTTVEPTTTPEPTTTSTTTTTTPEPTTTSTTTTTTPEPTTTSTTTTTTPEPTTTSTTTTTTPEPTTTSTTTTTTPEPTTTSTTTTTPEPTTTSTTTPEPTTTTTTTPEPTTTSTTTTKPTTTSSTTPEPTTTTQEPTTDCPSCGLLPNGCPEDFNVFLLLPNEEDCSKFYYCNFGEKVETDCPEGTLFNAELQVCDWPQNVKCSATTPEPTTTTQEPTTDCPSCGLLPNGCPEDFNVFLLLPNEEDCSKFYYCNFGEKVETDCPEGTLFNAELQVCDWPQNVKCSSTTEAPTTEGSGSEDGRLPNGCPEDFTVFQLLPNKEDCSKFYYCNFGELVETDCPEGTQFNAELQVCDWPWNVNCTGNSGSSTSAPTTEAPSNSTSAPTTSAPTTSVPTTEGSGSTPEDGRLPNGCPKDFTVFQLLPNKEDCSKFYYCNFGELVETDCPEGTQFNAQIQVCDWPWNVDCQAGSGSGDGSSTTNSPSNPPSSSTSTEGPTNSTTGGPTNSTTEGPTNPGGPISPSEPSSTTPSSSTTEEASNGETLPNGCPADWSVFQLLPNEEYCNKFYYCNFGELVETTCPEGTVFNPAISVCDWPQNVDCGSKGIDNGQQTTENPNLLPNGCPTDFTVSQLLPHEEYCNKFYYCNFGELVETTCPETLVFNPTLQVCDWPQNVNCGDKGIDNGSGNGNSNDEKCKNNCNIAPWAADESTSFWRCEGDVAVKVNCSQGLQFNAESGTCDYAPA